MTMPHRPKPDGFRAVFIAIGWEGIERHYRTNWRVIARWVDEEGRDELVAARADHVRRLLEDQRARRDHHRMVALGLSDATAVHIRRFGVPRPEDVGAERARRRNERPGA